MPEPVAAALVLAIQGYAAAGLAFAAIFLIRGVGRVDARAADTGVGFRLIILPGVVLFWPVLAQRWRTAMRQAA